MPGQDPAYSIRTLDGSETVTTPWQSGEGWDIGHWLEHHIAEVDASDQPAHDTLETRWDGDGGPVSHETGRRPGESDEDFKARHFVGVSDRMGEDPPVTP